MIHTTKSVLALATLAALGLAAALPQAANAQGSLSGAYYHAPSITTFSLADAKAFMNANGPSGYFTSTQNTLATGYTGRDASLITDFLGTDGVSFTGTTGNLSDVILSLSGSVNVTTAGTFTFSTTSDDGSALYIDGNKVVDNDGLHTSQAVTATSALSAGSHSVQILYFNRGLLPGSNGYANLSANLGGLTATPTPEPSSVAAFAFTGLGVLGMALTARKRRTA